MPAADIPEDPLKEPMNARSRLRRVRQEEAAKKYAETYQQRVEGSISSVRKTPNSNVSVEASVNTPASGDGYYLAGPTPRDVNRASYTTTASRPQSKTAVMEGRAVNVAGQSLDGQTTAISRLLHGDFYTVRGPTVHELQQKKEGKFMRFRAESASRPPNCDIVAPVHDAATMTRQTKSQTLLRQKKDHAVQHQPQSAKKNQYDPSYYDANYYDAVYGGDLREHSNVFDRSNGARSASAGGRRPGASSSATATAGRQFRGNHPMVHPATDEDDVRYMEPLDLDRVFADPPSQRRGNSSNRRPGTATTRASNNSAGRCGSAMSKQATASYCGPTASYQKKVESNAETRLRKHQDAEDAERKKLQWAAGGAAQQQQASSSSRRGAYETALQHQNQHPSGQAAILSNDELRKIMTLVDKPRLYQSATPGSARASSGYHPRDNEGIIS